MKVSIEKISREKQQEVLIRCYEVNGEVLEIAKFVKATQEGIEVFYEQGMKVIPLFDIYYVEAVDNHVFVYSKKDVYEIKMRLYEFEQMYGERQFFRCSKAVIVNLLKIQSLKPALNGRFLAVLQNGENVIIARKYVSDFKVKLHGGIQNE